MSHWTRRMLFFISTLIFIALAATVLFYAAGFRYVGGEIVTTGGLAVTTTPPTDTSIFINSKLIKTTSLLTRKIFKQSLTPGFYSIRVERDGFHPWSKTVEVSPERVTEVHALLIENPVRTDIILRGNYQRLSTWNVSTLMLENSEAQYFNIEENAFMEEELLEASTTPMLPTEEQEVAIASTTQSSTNFVVADSHERFLWWNRNDVYVTWFDIDDLPHYTENINNQIFRAQHPVVSARFYPGEDAVIVVTTNEIYVVEVDGRGGNIATTLYKGKAPLIATPDPGTPDLYVLDDGTLIRFRLQ